MYKDAGRLNVFRLQPGMAVGRETAFKSSDIQKTNTLAKQTVKVRFTVNLNNCKLLAHRGLLILP